MEWGDAWSGIEEPPVRLVEGDTGRRIVPMLVDSETGAPLRDVDVRAVHIDEAWNVHD